MIEVNHLSKKYGDHYAVKDLTFHVKEGQIYGFLGPNGAGKSTTMNIMTGYLAPTDGEIRINGHDIMQEPEEARMCIGYLPEIPPVYLDMTVQEYLMFVAELKKVPRKERKGQVTEAMEMTRITDMRNRLIKNLSKGYRQRVGLSQSLLGTPKILILDEPTVGLDPKQLIEIRDLIRSLRGKHTIILSSHILSEVSALCDQVLIISKGELVACDTPEGLTKLMSGETVIELTVKGSREAVEEVLAGFPEITGYTAEQYTGELVKAEIKTAQNMDLRDELSLRLAEKRMPVMQLSVNVKSLEDIFLELTGSGTEAAGEQKTDENTGKGEKA